MSLAQPVAHRTHVRAKRGKVGCRRPVARRGICAHRLRGFRQHAHRTCQRGGGRLRAAPIRPHLLLCASGLWNRREVLEPRRHRSLLLVGQLWYRPFARRSWRLAVVPQRLRAGGSLECADRGLERRRRRLRLAPVALHGSVALSDQLVLQVDRLLALLPLPQLGFRCGVFVFGSLGDRLVERRSLRHAVFVRGRRRKVCDAERRLRRGTPQVRHCERVRHRVAGAVGLEFLCSERDNFFGVGQVVVARPRIVVAVVAVVRHRLLHDELHPCGLKRFRLEAHANHERADVFGRQVRDVVHDCIRKGRGQETARRFAGLGDPIAARAVDDERPAVGAAAGDAVGAAHELDRNRVGVGCARRPGRVGAFFERTRRPSIVGVKRPRGADAQRGAKAVEPLALRGVAVQWRLERRRHAIKPLHCAPTHSQIRWPLSHRLA